MEKNKKISEEEIKKILNDNYDIVANQVEEINRGTADIFKIIADKGKYILKYFSEGRTKESVIKETNIINFLLILKNEKISYIIILQYKYICTYIAYVKHNKLDFTYLIRKGDSDADLFFMV